MTHPIPQVINTPTSPDAQVLFNIDETIPNTTTPSNPIPITGPVPNPDPSPSIEFNTTPEDHPRRWEHVLTPANHLTVPEISSSPEDVPGCLCIGEDVCKHAYEGTMSLFRQLTSPLTSMQSIEVPPSQSLVLSLIHI